MADEFSLNIEQESSQLKMELLAALLEPDDAPYPWNVTDIESEAYFVANEALLTVSEDQIAAPRAAFFSALDSLWANTSHNQDSITNLDRIQNILQQRAPGVPQSWIQAIAIRASIIVSTSTSIAEQLVQCVQELVPNWEEEDLLTLARPFAYAMRGSEEAVDAVMSKLQDREWQNLTEIEQTKIGLAVARSALKLQTTSEI